MAFPVVDPVTLSVVRGWLEQVADEMGVALTRSAFSPVVSEAYDRACGIYAYPSGETIVQDRTGLPIFIGTMQAAVQASLEAFRGEGFEDGDVVAMNDPYLGGTHLQDVKLIRPYFYDGELLFVLANTAHWMDVGGAVPGGFAPLSTEIFQEGIRFKPVKIVKGHRLDRDLLSLITQNVRLPEDIEGDFRAQLNSLSVGAARLTESLAKYGAPLMRRCVEEMADASERQMRSHIREIPDGTYEAEDFLDSDGVQEGAVRVHLRLTVEDDSLHFDFSASDPPQVGPVNLALSTTVAACNAAIKHIFPDVPINAGCFKPLSFDIPRSTFLHAAHPSPISGYFEAASRVADVVWGALVQAIPGSLFGTPFSTAGPFLVGERIADGYRVAVVNYSGGYGGTAGHDGLLGACPPMSMAPMAPIEIYEHRNSFVFTRFAIREDSAGPGEFAGGCGTEYEFLYRGGDAVWSTIADRGRFPAKGVLGGHSGQCTIVAVRHPDGSIYQPRHLTKDQNVPLRNGDVVSLSTPGGGGYGDPNDRDLLAVARDVRLGYLSDAAARSEYRVVMKEGGVVDDEATRVLRASR